MELKGFDSLVKKFNTLGRGIQNKIMSPALKAGAKVVLTESKRLAPVLSGTLRKTLKVKKGVRSRKAISWYVQTGTREKMGISMDDKAYYPASVEFGTRKIKAKPYMRPALVNARTPAIKAVGEKMGEKMDDVLRKMAAKK
jgi:HK97 gp10 family phage protein